MIAGIRSLYMVEAAAVNLASTGMTTGYFYPYDRSQIIPISFILNSAQAEYSETTSGELELSVTLAAHPNRGASQLLKRPDLGLVIESYAGQSWYMPTRIVTSNANTNATTSEANKELISIRTGLKPCGWFCYGSISDLHINAQQLHEQVGAALSANGGVTDGIDLSGLNSVAIAHPEWTVRHKVEDGMIWVCLRSHAINGLHWHLFYYAPADSLSIDAQLFCLTTRDEYPDVKNAVFIPVAGLNIDTYYGIYMVQQSDIRAGLSLF